MSVEILRWCRIRIIREKISSIVGAALFDWTLGVVLAWSLSVEVALAARNFGLWAWLREAACGAAKLGLSVKSITVGLLALQGDFDAHQKIFQALGVSTRLVRAPRDLEEVDGLVIPGGESTVMSRLSERYGLLEPLKKRVTEGLPAFGTCAGLIFLAKDIEGASSNFSQTTLGVLNCSVARNAYGAQRDSFQTQVEVPALNGFLSATFIRAPRITSVGEGVETLASWKGEPVVVRQNNIIGCAFHPEMAGETRLHTLWLDSIEQQQTR